MFNLQVFELLNFRVRREKLKADKAIESCRTVAAWTKKVVIERNSLSSHDLVDGIIVPNVSIVKER